MKSTRRAILLACTALLLSCGGGGEGKEKVFAFYGDSLTHGDIPSGRLPVTPCARLAEYLDRIVLDMSLGAATLPEAFGEEVLFQGVPLPYGRLPYEPFQLHFKRAPEDVCILRFGGADYLLGTPPDRFRELYRDTIDLIRASGKIPVIVGLYDHPEHPGLTGFDLLCRAVAEEKGCDFVDLRALVPTVFPADFADGLHGNQQTSDRWMKATFDAVRKYS